jgi:pimeloyl-ACP methyl ester carboxylesterase
VVERVDILAGGHRLEGAWFGGRDPSRALVLLHEGLGSVSTWREWPAQLALATGCSVFVYSRLGYGESDPAPLPLPIEYMHREGLDILPEVLDRTGIERAVLVGHSDGGSIAIIHAGRERRDPRVAGLALLAPHVFCEAISVESIEKAREAFSSGDLREKLAKHHRDVDSAFFGWNGAWLDPAFRAWNIEAFLPQIEIPVLVIQGLADPYGTLAQVDAIERGVSGPFERLLLPECGHVPQKDRPEETTAAVLSFARRALAV